MADSLLLVEANLELVGATTNPEYRLGQLDLGAAEPDTTLIKSLLLDGDLISGKRTGNRSVTLNIPVFAIGVSGIQATRAALTAATDKLIGAVNAQSFTLQWTPDGGQPIRFDCSRGRGQRTHSIVMDNQGKTPVVLTFQAKPYGRSPDLQMITAAGTSTQLDSFDAAVTGATLSTTTKYEGTGSAQVTITDGAYPSPAGVYAHSTAPVTKTFGSAVNMATAKGVSLRFRWSPPQIKLNGGAAQDWTTTMIVTLTLTSAAGNATIGTSKKLKSGSTAWNLLTFDLTSIGTLDLTAVTGYSISFASVPTYNFFGTTYTFATGTSNAFVDDLRWIPSSAALTSTTHGANLMLPAILGSARAPANLSLANLAGTAFSSFLLHAPPDDQDIDAAILVALSGASTNQTVTVAQPNANYNGTYSLVLGCDTIGGSAVTVTVTITQLENGSTFGSTVLTRTYTSGQGLVVVGEVTLPLYAVAAENTATSFTIQVQITGTDRYTELMLLDTRGQTALTDLNFQNTRVIAYVDEPTPLQSGPMVYSSSSDRTAAHSCMDRMLISGGPIVVDPGDNKMLTWVGTGVPVVTASYYPRWLDERVS